ncbi:MAG: hypothetical protein AAB778_00600 [Patescibacteria group bacterium]
MQEQTLKTPVEYIKEAWGIYTKKENFVLFAKVMAVVVILTSAIGYLISYFYSSNDWQNVGFVVLTLLSIVVGIWSQTVKYFVVLKIGNTEKEIFRLGYKNMLKFFLISLVVGLIVLVGLVLLVIPAIMFGVWYSFSTWLVLDKNMGVFEALKQSKAMVKGRFWKVLGRTVTFGLFAFFVSIVVVAIPYAGNLIISFVAPLFMLPFYLMYRDLVTGTG